MCPAQGNPGRMDTPHKNTLCFYGALSPEPGKPHVETEVQGQTGKAASVLHSWGDPGSDRELPCQRGPAALCPHMAVS